jgi:hypothetical protein
MRTLVLAATSLLLVSTAAGCNNKEPAPTPAPPVGSVIGAPLPAPAAIAPPAYVVFTGQSGAARTVGAVIEDASAAPIALSTAGVDTTFAGSIAGKRAVLAERAADKSIIALVAARIDTGERSALGAFPAGKYADAPQIKVAGEAVVIELARAGSDAHDVFALRAGAAPVLLAESATLVGAAKGHAAVLAGGNLIGVKLDGSGKITLGAGDGHDKVAEVQDDRILLTLHAGASGDVRLIGIDGSGKVDVGKADVDESAVALTAQRVVYLRHAAAGAVLVSASLDGKAEQALTDAQLDAKPIQVTADGQILFGSAAGAFMTVAANGGATRVLDPNAGTNVRVGAVRDGQVVYTSDVPHWPALRVAKLDGSGVVSLLEEPPSVPFFAGFMPGGRVVYYRTLAGQIEGGRVFSVKLDGTDRRPVGTAVTGTDGKALPSGPADQDFEAITPSGRVILESEFEVGSTGSQLVVGSTENEGARLLTGADHVRFAALVH